MRVICIADKFEDIVYDELEIGSEYNIVHIENCQCGCGNEICKIIEFIMLWYPTCIFAEVLEVEDIQLTEQQAEDIRTRQKVKARIPYTSNNNKLIFIETWNQ